MKVLTERLRNLIRRLAGKPDRDALDMDKALSIAESEGRETYPHYRWTKT